MDIKDSPRATADAPETAGVATDARHAVDREVADARDRAKAGVETLRAQAANAGDTISSMISERAERGKDEAANGMVAFAQAIRRASDELGERDRSMPARLVQEAAQGLERIADGVQTQSVGDMARSLTTFGRERPATFLAGCLIAGAAVGRLMTASGHAADPYAEPHGASGGGARPQGYGHPVMDRDGRFDAGADSAVAGGGTSAGAGVDVARQAGVFGGPVAPSSSQYAPGDIGDPLGTRTDRDIGMPGGEPARREGGRDGDL